MLLHRALVQAASGDISLQGRAPEWVRLRCEFERRQRCTVAAIAGGALLISGTILGAGSAWSIAAVALGGLGTLVLIGAWRTASDPESARSR